MGNNSALEEAAKRYLFGINFTTTIDKTTNEEEVEYFLNTYSKEFSDGVLFLNNSVPAYLLANSNTKAKMLARFADRLKEQRRNEKSR